MKVKIDMIIISYFLLLLKRPYLKLESARIILLLALEITRETLERLLVFLKQMENWTRLWEIGQEWCVQGWEVTRKVQKKIHKKYKMIFHWMNLILGSFFQNNVYFEKTIAFKVIRDTEKR